MKTSLTDDKDADMEKTIEYTVWIGCNLGVLYFLIRFFYFGVSRSFESEIQKVVRYKYFLLIKAADVSNKKENNIRILLNMMLRVFYFIAILAIILTFIYALSQSV